MHRSLAILGTLFFSLILVLPTVARGDDYDKNLLLLRKALREGNCPQAYEASSRLVQIEPDRPEAYLGLGDAAMCMMRRYEALTAWVRYRDLGGTDDVGPLIEEALGHLTPVRIDVSIWEHAVPGPFVRRSQFEPRSALDRMPRHLTCDVAGVDGALQGVLARVDDNGCEVRVVPGRSATIEVTAAGFSWVDVPVPSPVQGVPQQAVVELVREADPGDFGGQWVCATTEYGALMDLDGNEPQPLAADPVWVPSGTYRVELSSPSGDVLDILDLDVGASITDIVDVTGPRLGALRRSHGQVFIPGAEPDLRARLVSGRPGQEGVEVVLEPGSKQEVLTGTYVVLLERRARGDAIDDREWFELYSGSVDIEVWADRPVDLLSGPLREIIDEAWIARIEVSDVPRGSYVFVDDVQVAFDGLEDRSVFAGRIRPGNYTFRVASNWRDPWERTISLEPRSETQLVYNARLLPTYGKARDMRRAALATVIGGGLSFVASAVFYVLGGQSFTLAKRADSHYLALEGGIDQEGYYIEYDQTRREMLDQSVGHFTASGVFLGVGGVCVGTSLLLYLLSPKDPARKVLGVSTMQVVP